MKNRRAAVVFVVWLVLAGVTACAPSDPDEPALSDGTRPTQSITSAPSVPPAATSLVTAQPPQPSSAETTGPVQQLNEDEADGEGTGAVPNSSVIGSLSTSSNGIETEETYRSFVTITDDTAAIEVSVPEEWSQVDGRPYQDDAGNQLYDVRASADLEAFTQTWTEPGIIVTASTDLAQIADEVSLLDETVGMLSTACTYLGRQPYDDGLYTGQIDLYDACGGTTGGYAVIGAVPSSRTFILRVEVQVVDERDLGVMDVAIETFQVIGDV